ncbi:hypothetical protein TWF481_000299 [Arthrobotrys musiformis]|uniref:Uncharacterized protein n=1 Tax=Arthrobotrys musiformis TaxID=47236 RepID=A0AAV9WNE3_9PEZI
MFGSSRLNLLVVALITFVSFVTARTVITSQTCTTRYCGYAVPQNKIFKTTKTIRKTVKYTVTRWKTTAKPKSTHTLKTTKTVTSQRYTTVSKDTTVTRTVLAGGKTHTEFVTHISTILKPSATVTVSATTKTITPPTITIPAPSGFVGVAEDPDNKAALTEPRFTPPGGWKRHEPVLEVEHDRRSAEPEPAPEPEPEPEPVAVANAKGKHVTALTCTKTLLTKTGKIELWKTTTKWTGPTTKTIFVATKTTTPPISTVTKFNTKVVKTTELVDNLVVSNLWFTTTRYTTSTKYLKTVTSTLPAATFHASCGDRNRSPQQKYFYSWAVYNAGPDRAGGEVVDVILSNGTAYDCCVACHTYKKAGTCIGTVWRSNIWNGIPFCAISPDPDCVDEVFEPEFRSTCELIIASSNAASQCRKHSYDFYNTGTEPYSAVSNGLGCRRYKFGQFW